jgi:DNA polymerase III subunit gamma/tau
MGDYLVRLCEQEVIAIEPTVVPLVVRAGAGSARDSLSVLDQLIGGAGPDGITHTLATALLGYTPDALLDEIVDAIAAQDGNTVFGVVDKVIESGQDPRRFAEDLLQRFRDLVIATAVPDAAAKGLLQVSDDQADRLSGQASRFGPAELTRAADVLSAALTEMRGAIAPRLLFEITCARLLLPRSDGTSDALHARLDRVERRLSVATHLSASDEPAPAGEARHESEPQGGDPGAPDLEVTEPDTADSDPADMAERPADLVAPERAPTLTLVDLRHQWPDILSRIRNIRRFTWVMLNQNAQLKELAGSVLTITLANAGARESFVRSGSEQVLRQALNEQLGVDWKIEAVVEGAMPARSGRDDPDEAVTPPPPSRRSEVGAVKQEIRATRTDPPEPGFETAPETAPDDEVIDDGALTRQELLARELGAQVIEEIRHQP